MMAVYFSTFLNAPSFGIFLFQPLLGDFLEGGKLYHRRVLLAWVDIRTKGSRLSNRPPIKQ